MAANPQAGYQEGEPSMHCFRSMTLILLFMLAMEATMGQAQMVSNPPAALRPAQTEGKWGYIDAARKFVIEPRFERAGPFSQGLAPVRLAGRYGYIDASGRLRIDQQFELADSFSEGLAAVKSGDKFGYINDSATLVHQP